MKKEEALELVDDFVDGVVEISKEENIAVIDYDDLKKDLRVALKKDLEEEIDEPTSPLGANIRLNEQKLL